MSKTFKILCLIFASLLLLPFNGYTQEKLGPSAANIGLSDEEIHSLRNELCLVLAVMPTASTNFVGAEEIEKRLVQYFKINDTLPDYKLKIAQHWNNYSSKMICEATNGTYPTQHLYKRALAMNYHSPILDHYFFSDEVAFPIDPNTIEILADGSPSTVLDYIDAMLSMPNASNTYNIGQVAELGEIVVDFFGGKRVAEMSEEEISRRTEGLLEYYTWYTPQLYANQLPSELEHSILCKTADLDTIKGTVNKAYKAQTSDLVLSDHRIKGATKITPGAIRCFSHPHFGIVFRQEIEIFYDSSRRDSIRHLVYWKTLYGNREMKYGYSNR